MDKQFYLNFIVYFHAVGIYSITIELHVQGISSESLEYS